MPLGVKKIGESKEDFERRISIQPTTHQKLKSITELLAQDNYDALFKMFFPYKPIPTDVIDKINNKINHLIAISSLTQEQVSSEEYGEVYARLKTVEVLKNHGILGRYEDLRDGTKRLHYLKTKTIKREILFDTREDEDAILMERKETQDPRLKKIVDIFGSPYAP